MRLGAQRAPDGRRGDIDRLTQAYRPGVDWTSTALDTYMEIIDVISAWPEVVVNVLDRALLSLDEPEARHPSARILREFLERAEALGRTNELDPQTTEHIRRLLTKQRDQEVLRAACRWVRRLDVDGSDADLDRAELVRDADDARGHRQPDLSALRNDLAQRHSQRAQDMARDADARVSHLQMAATLNAASARAAAVQLAQSPTTAVRRAAAMTLAETTGSPEEHETLAALAAAEDDAQIAKYFDAALHRLASGDAGEALRNLAEMLELPLDGLDPNVLIPDEQHRNRFAEWTDKARARSADAHDPGAFLEAAINVADQMVDLTLIARQDVGTRVLKPEQIEALRTNAANRLDIGALVTQQQLVGAFRWFSAVATLREKRAAHPSRIGTTEPSGRRT